MALLFTCFCFKNIKRKRITNEVDVVYVLEDVDYDYKNRNIKLKVIDGNFSLRKFTWNEMESLTSNFSPSRVIGYGGFSNVFLANFPDSTQGAIKICSSNSERLNRIFKQELEILLHLKHDNIVKLLGFCNDREEGILVFEYVSNGTLQEKLHSEKQFVLPWKNRMAIAFQLAEAIEYLHEKCPLQIVHGDVKASNILLDEQLNCKVCDFGSAKMGFSSALLTPSSRSMNRMMLGSPGYTDPHYLRTGIASKKNDVYSFGVILLELITGIQAHTGCNGEMLTAKASPILSDSAKVEEMIDPRFNLAGGFILEEAMAMASLAAMCLSESPSIRPSASDIVEIMRNRIDSVSFSYSPDQLKA